MPKSALIIGASRGLGWGLARELVAQGWRVVGAVRDPSSASPLRELASRHEGRVEIVSVDIACAAAVAALRSLLAERRFDLLFVVAGVTNDIHEPIGRVPTEEFVRVMVTNALGPLRVVEACIDLVTEDGQVAVMSSELGSIADNDGGWELYRASKASLNTLMRCFAARHERDARTYYAMAPGWVRTDMGGEDAPLSIEASVCGMLLAMQARRGARGLLFLDQRNQVLPW